MRQSFKFIGRAGNVYIWQSRNRMPGDSRVMEIRCPVDYFWNPPRVGDEVNQ